MADSRKPILWRRFYEYLQRIWHKNPEYWVNRRTLFNHAIHQGYTKSEIWDAIEKLETKMQIAKISDEDGAQYRYLNLSPKEQREMERQEREFHKVSDGKGGEN